MWILFSLMSAISDAARNILNKRLARDVTPPVLNIAIYGFSLPVYFVLLLHTEIPQLHHRAALLILIHVALDATSTLCLTNALRMGQLSIVAPLLGCSSLVIIATSPVVVQERVGVLGAVGALVVVVGIFLIHNETFSASLLNSVWSVLRAPGSRLALIVAILWAADGQVLKLAASQINWQFLLGISSFVIVMVLLLGLAATNGLNQLWYSRKHILMLLSLGISAAGSLVFMMIALGTRGGLVAYVVSLKRSSVLLGILGGVLIFRERLSLNRVVGSAMIFGGIVLITAFG
jgi:uncharacterized membrane protein